MRVQIKLCRPHDCDPDDHLYGEPFDSAVDALVGGRWSAPREDRAQQPRATLQGEAITIGLREDGPVIEFFLQNLGQLPDYVSAIAGVVSAWIAARALRKQELPPNDFRGVGGTVVEAGDFRITTRRDLTPEELIEVASAVAALRQEHRGGDDGPAPA